MKKMGDSDNMNFGTHQSKTDTINMNQILFEMLDEMKDGQ